MRPIEAYLNEIKRKADIETDKALADRLGIKHPSICLIRKGVNTPSDDLCKRMARLAGDPVEKVLLLAAESRAPETTKAAWEHIFRTMAKAGVFTLMAGFMMVMSTMADASTLHSPPQVRFATLQSIHYATLLWITFEAMPCAPLIRIWLGVVRLTVPAVNGSIPTLHVIQERLDEQ